MNKLILVVALLLVSYTFQVKNMPRNKVLAQTMALHQDPIASPSQKLLSSIHGPEHQLAQMASATNVERAMAVQHEGVKANESVVMLAQKYVVPGQIFKQENF